MIYDVNLVHHGNAVDIARAGLWITGLVWIVRGPQQLVRVQCRDGVLAPTSRACEEFGGVLTLAVRREIRTAPR